MRELRVAALQQNQRGKEHVWIVAEDAPLEPETFLLRRQKHTNHQQPCDRFHKQLRLLCDQRRALRNSEAFNQRIPRDSHPTAPEFSSPRLQTQLEPKSSVK